MISNISNEEKGIVKLLEGLKHNFEDGDEVTFTGVEGMEELKADNKMGQEPASINGTLHKVTVINPNSFYIGNTLGYAPYIRNGIAR